MPYHLAMPACVFAGGTGAGDSIPCWFLSGKKPLKDRGNQHEICSHPSISNLSATVGKHSRTQRNALRWVLECLPTVALRLEIEGCEQISC